MPQATQNKRASQSCQGREVDEVKRMLTLLRLPEIENIVNAAPRLTVSEKIQRWQAKAATGVCPSCGDATIETRREPVGRAGNGLANVYACTKPLYQCGFEVPCPTPSEDTMDDLTQLANFIEHAGELLAPRAGEIIRDPKTGREELANVAGSYDTTSGEVLVIWYPARQVERRLLVTMDGSHWLQLVETDKWITAPRKYSQYYNLHVQRRAKRAA